MLIRPNMTGDTGLLGIALSAPRDSDFARDMVQTNLGLSADDLGVSEEDGQGLAGFENAGDDDDGDGGEGERFGREGERDDGPDMGEGEPPQQRPVRRSRDQWGREPQARRQQQEQQRQPQLPQSAQVKPDARGNLVDASGQIVARAGKEARLYQYGVNATRQLQQLQGQYRNVSEDLTNRLNRAVEIGTELDTRIKAFEARDQEITRLGITPQEQLQAMQVVARSKTDPIGALKFILTQAAANGIDLTQLGMQGGADMKTMSEVLKQQLETHLQPLKQRTALEPRQEQERKTTEREQSEAQGYVKNFFAANPEAQQFVPVFHAVLQRNPGTPLDTIWARIQLNLERRQRAMPQGDGGRTRRRGAPNGRSRLPESQNNNSRGSMAPVTQTYEQVTRGVLDELGIK